METLKNILNNMKDCFIFSKTHHLININLFRVSIFDTCLKLKQYRNDFKDINLFNEIENFLRELKNEGVIYNYQSVKILNCFYIYLNEFELFEDIEEITLNLPEYSDNIA